MTQSIKNLFPKTSAGEDYSKEIAEFNVNIFPIICIFLSLLDCILIASTVVYILSKNVIGNWIYLGIYIFKIIYSVITMLIIRKLGVSLERNAARIDRIVTAFVCINYIFAGVLTCLDIHYIQNFNTLVGGCIEMCFLYYKPKRVLPIFIIECLIIYIGGAFYLGFDIELAAKIINSLLLTVTVFIFSVHRYCAKLYELEQSRKLTALKNQFQQKAEVDTLTNLYNRAYLDSYLEDYDFTQKNTIAIAILDIDDFKQINDTYGHLTGDECLKLIGRTVKKFSRSKNKNSIAFRYGGEEILLLFENYSKDEILNMTESLRVEIMNASVMGIKFTASIGVFYCRKPFSSFKEMLKMADKNLYTAKKEGKNRVIIN